MKRFFPVIISTILLCSIVLTGCQTNTDTTAAAKDILVSNNDYLTNSFAEDSVSDKQYSFSDFTDVLSDWADEKDITVDTVTDDYIVLFKDSSGEINNVENFAFHTLIDFNSDPEGCLESAAVIMTIMESAQNHEKLTGIFTSVNDAQPEGTYSLDSSYLKHDNFIDITYNKKSVIYNTFAGSSDMAAKKELEITAPNYTKAYMIKFKGKENQSAYFNRGVYPNPIKVIGDLLASCQTSTILFELASFEGGTHADQIPSEVTATIVIHENDVESLKKRFEKSYEKIEEKYEELDDESITFEYAVTPVDLPDEVISKEDTENIVSLMYTMINGTYLRDENDEVQAFSNIGKITAGSDGFNLFINAKSLDDEIMAELESTVRTICGLSNIEYRKINSTKVWTNPPETPLVAALSDIFDAKTYNMLEMKHMTALLDKSSSLNAVTLGTNIDEMKKDIDKLLEYISIAGLTLNTDQHTIE